MSQPLTSRRPRRHRPTSVTFATGTAPYDGGGRGGGGHGYQQYHQNGLQAPPRIRPRPLSMTERMAVVFLHGREPPPPSATGAGGVWGLLSFGGSCVCMGGECNGFGGRVAAVHEPHDAGACS